MIFKTNCTILLCGPFQSIIDEKVEDIFEDINQESLRNLNSGQKLKAMEAKNQRKIDAFIRAALCNKNYFVN